MFISLMVSGDRCLQLQHQPRTDGCIVRFITLAAAQDALQQLGGGIRGKFRYTPHAVAMTWVRFTDPLPSCSQMLNATHLSLQGGPCSSSRIPEASEGRLSGVSGSTWAADGQQPAGHCRFGAISPSSCCAGGRAVPQASAAAGPAAAVPAAGVLWELDGGRPTSE